MCLPVGLLKTLVGISCLLTMALGVIAIICGATLGNDEIFVGDVQNSRKIIMGVTIGFGVFLIVLAILGLIGAWKKSSLYLTIYNIGVAIFFVIFLAIAIAAFVVFKKYSSSDVQSTNLCKEQTWLQDLDDYANNANKLLCSLSCPCGANITSTWITENTSLIWVVNNGPVRVQDCPNYNNSDDSKLNVMRKLEEKFDCAGICTTSTYYTFSDVNRGQPTDECSQKLMDILLKYSKEIGAVTVVIAGVLLLIMVFSCCLCCHPKKKEAFDGTSN